MKATITESPAADDVFPRLMQNTYDKTYIVLFTDSHTGTSISQQGGKLGRHFSGGLDLTCWEPFYGAVTLSND